MKKPRKNATKPSKTAQPKPMGKLREYVKSVDGRKLEAEPRYIVDGKVTDAPFHNEMLKSEKGNRMSDQLAIKTAMEGFGLSRKEAMELMGMTDGKEKEFLRSKIQSSKESEYTPGEFSEHEWVPIDLEKAKAESQREEKTIPEYRAFMNKLRAEAKKFGRTID